MSLNQNLNGSNKRDDYSSSVHFLKGVHLLRAIVLVVLLGSMDFNLTLKNDPVSHSVIKWANSFVLDNDLLSPQLSVLNSYSLASNTQLIEGGESTMVPEGFLSNKIEPSSSRSNLKPTIKSDELSLYLPTKSFFDLFIIENGATRILVNDFDGLHRSRSNVRLLEPEEFYSVLIDQGSPSIEIKGFTKKWFFSGAIGPQLVSGTIAQPKSNLYQELTGLNEIISSSEGSNTSTNNASYGVLVNLGFRIAKNWDVISGLKYSVFNGKQTAYYDSEVIRRQTIYTVVATPGAEGEMNYSTHEEEVEYTNYFSDTLRLNYRLSTYEVPLLIRYNKSFGKWNAFASTGVSGVFKTRYNSTYISNEIGMGSIITEDFGFSAINVNLGMGMAYSITKDLSFQLSSNYSKGIPVYRSSIFQSKVYTLGVYTGFTYWFK